jgi:hypothetical protein
MAERNEFTGIDYARGSVKHPFIAFLLLRRE